MTIERYHPVLRNELPPTLGTELACPLPGISQLAHGRLRRWFTQAAPLRQRGSLAEGITSTLRSSFATTSPKWLRLNETSYVPLVYLLYRYGHVSWSGAKRLGQAKRHLLSPIRSEGTSRSTRSDSAYDNRQLLGARAFWRPQRLSSLPAGPTLPAKITVHSRAVPGIAGAGYIEGPSPSLNTCP